jgi:hypothetical protein
MRELHREEGGGLPSSSVNSTSKSDSCFLACALEVAATTQTMYSHNVEVAHVLHFFALTPLANIHTNWFVPYHFWFNALRLAAH